MDIDQLPTPALVIESTALDRNLDRMSTAHPGPALRPHVKAHKCTALAAVQRANGHTGFTCATPREVLGMARVGLGDDLLLANESLDPARLRAMAELEPDVTVAIDSDATRRAAVEAGIRRVVVDVDVGLPRCGVAPDRAGVLADDARAAGLDVRGVMGYEGHLMMLTDRSEQAERVDTAMTLLRRAHDVVGGDIVSAGGTGTFDLHDDTGVTEIQAGSYALMDTQYGTLGLPFEQAVYVVGTVISVHDRYAVADVGLKALGMDHGDPDVLVGDEDETRTVWFCSDEHVTFSTTSIANVTSPAIGERVWVVPAHVDPTMAMHATAWLVRDREVIDRWPI
ncbi:MAG: alanine racemase, partial [Ilumatobacteraceae bacterium]